MGWVLNHVTASGTDKLLLIGIANHANADGGEAWPSVETLARYSCLQPRGVQRALRRLEDAGVIVVHRQEGGSRDCRQNRRPNLYEIVGMGSALAAMHAAGGGVAATPPQPSAGVAPTPVRGGLGDRLGVAPRPPKPSLEPSVEPSNDFCPAPCADSPPVEVAVFEPDSPEQLCRELHEMLTARGVVSGVPRDPVSRRWVESMDRLLRIDGRTPEQVRGVLRWLNAGRDDVAVFWRPNVLSPDKLRQRWDQMREQHAAARTGRSRSAAALSRPDQPDLGDVVRIVRERRDVVEGRLA